MGQFSYMAINLINKQIIFVGIFSHTVLLCMQEVYLKYTSYGVYFNCTPCKVYLKYTS